MKPLDNHCFPFWMITSHDFNDPSRNSPVFLIGLENANIFEKILKNHHIIFHFLDLVVALPFSMTFKISLMVVWQSHRLLLSVPKDMVPLGQVT